MRKFFGSLIITTLLIDLMGCASVDFEHPKEVTTTIQSTGDTHIGRQVEDLVATFPDGYSGFIPIFDGIDALSARLLMAGRAERTIDAQYYLLKPGITGEAFLYELLRAADRGVRVRLLLDDMFTSGYDAGMVGFDSHPNIEVRIFNPFASRSARFWDGLTSFSRLNRRMHNKSLTVDNQVTLIGGRNIANVNVSKFLKGVFDA